MKIRHSLLVGALFVPIVLPAQILVVEKEAGQENSGDPQYRPAFQSEKPQPTTLPTSPTGLGHLTTSFSMLRTQEGMRSHSRRNAAM